MAIDMETRAQALTLSVDADGVARIVFDTPGEKVNVLAKPVLEQLNAYLDQIEKDPAVKAVVIMSGKEDCFIAGANIEEIEQMNQQQATEGSQLLQRLFQRLTDLRVPTIAAIQGVCLGGGLELALACKGRVVSDHPKTQLGLPEIKLGLIPGAGGTQRLPRLITLVEALPMILQGKSCYPKKAVKLGLADEMVPPNKLWEVARQRALDGKVAVPKKDWTHSAFGRNFVCNRARQETMKATKGHYPAALAAIDAVQRGLGKSLKEGLAIEAELFGKLVETQASKSCIHLFHATTELKKELPARPKPVRSVGILGGGLMGGGIATVTADLGIPVRIKDISHEAIGKTLKGAREFFDSKRKRGRLTPYEANQRMDLISGTTAFTGFANLDMVIEAIPEDLILKQNTLRELEKVTRPDCIFASNTSSLPIKAIAEASSRPETVIGMHFFSPVPKMPLVEVIVHPGTADWVTATTVDLGRKMGKQVIVVNDGVGFYTSRILAPYLNEAMHLLAEGGDIEQIDQALVDFGFPVGPIALLDEVGIDVGAKVTKIMLEAFGDRMQPPEGMHKLLESGRMGRKNQKGFYLYGDARKGKKKEVDRTVYDLTPHGQTRRKLDPAYIQDRCVYAFLNEAAHCLHENVLTSARDGDIGAIFGLGFPPFLGGPFFHMDRLGLSQVVSRLEDLHRQVPRYAACPMLVEMARAGRCFF